MGGRGPFGSLRQLASGHWQASYWWDGIRHVAPRTFSNKGPAATWLATVEADLARGIWIDPRAGQVRFDRYSENWLQLRTDLRPRTRELYTSLRKLHLLPQLGGLELSRITPSVVRAWYLDLTADTGPGHATAARCYRLLRAILNTALTDELLVKNPCRVRGAGADRSPERPIASVAEVYALADAIAPRFRTAVLLASFCSLRRGEILGLQRGDVDLLHSTVSVRRAVASLANGTLYIGDPKTAAGRRTVAIPRVIAGSLEAHLDTFVADSTDAPVFTGEKGGLLRPHVLQAAWDKARHTTGLAHLHFHDLRHSGNTWAAATGASTAELMARMGHASAAAALRYQHATADRDRAIAEALRSLGDQALASVTRLVPAERRSS